MGLNNMEILMTRDQKAMQIYRYHRRNAALDKMKRDRNYMAEIFRLARMMNNHRSK